MPELITVAVPPAKPLLVFDGDCNFCKRCVARGQQITGERVDYLPFQDARIAEQFPELPRERCERAAQLINTDGLVYSAAEAIFRAIAPEKPWLLWSYRNLPGAATVSEAGYRSIAGNRVAVSKLTRWLWGESLERPSHVWVRGLFLRLLAVAYFIAFVSLWTQIDGLIGANGMQPAAPAMASLRQAADQQQIGLDRYRIAPTLCWWRADDSFLTAQCVAGAALSLLVIFGIAPAPCLFLMWAIYLSLSTVGGIFLGYQWDALLLEVGLLAIFLAPLRLWPRRDTATRVSTTMLWLLRWLMFRLMFASGCVKLLSGDATWHNLTALNYHYETQPLPTWIGWWAHQLPHSIQTASTAVMFFIELVLPFLIFLPRRLRLLSVWPFIALQVLIALTGNYCFFNFLTVILCVPLLDDRALLNWVPKKWRDRWQRTETVPRTIGFLRVHRFVIGIIAAVVLSITALLTLAMFHVPIGWAKPVMALYSWVAPLRSINSYGLFAVMTTSRPEIIVEGSVDGKTWLPYEFKYKAGDVNRRPRFVAPHQPRLDWQMWFASLGDVRGNPWFINFVGRLLQGSPEVLALMAHNPFPAAPPKYIRAVTYDYHFTDPATRRATGAWWRREFKGEYCPPLSLENFAPR